MDLGKLFSIIILSIFINNFVFSQFLGICPFMGVSKKSDSALGMGMAVTFVMTLASGVTWLIYYKILVPLNLEYLNIISFILIIASLVQFVEMFIQKSSPNLYKSLGVFLPLITTNCAVLGVAILNLQKEYNFIEATVNGFAAAVGFSIALLLMAGIRERLEYSDIPEAFKGVAIVFVTAGILAMAFMGFSGMKI
ncbi:MAG: electron transport complex subunit RsxA [Fusobacteria bacterium]|jgi:electron transport complex protein RnfA|nr:electron transport complex subunit RsxA [Fusobacteriota bacterium]